MNRLSVVWIIFLIASYTALLSQAATTSPSVTVIAPAVERTPEGLHGVLSYITVVAEEGSGHVYIDTWPLAEVDIQGSARLAVQVGCEVIQKEWTAYDFFITVRSDSPIIGGPSAGGAMTVAIIAALQGWNLDPAVIMTGTINPDETVGPIGGLYQKAQAASQVASLFLVPEGQTTIMVEEQQIIQQGPFRYIQTTQREVDLVEEGKKMGLEVKEVYDIRDAVYYFTGHRIEVPHQDAEPIKADFMNPYARQQLETVKNEYESLAGEIDAWNGSLKEDLEENFEYAKWCLFIAIFVFSLGIAGFGLTLAFDKSSDWKERFPKEE